MYYVFSLGEYSLTNLFEHILNTGSIKYLWSSFHCHDNVLNKFVLRELMKIVYLDVFNV